MGSLIMDSFSLNQLPDLLPLYFLPFCRIIALFSTAPIISEKAVTVRLRIALALLLTCLLPSISHPEPLSLASLSGILLVVNEIVLGIAMGLSMQFIFAAVRLAGEVIALQMGLSFASFFDASSHSSLSVVSRLITNLSFLVFLAMDGQLWIIDQLAQSLQKIPAYQMVEMGGTLAALVQLAKIIFSQALQLSLPLIFLLLGINFALGLLNRMAPQFSAFVVGFPLTLLLGIAALHYSMPLMIGAVQQFILEFSEQLLALFSPAH